MNQTALLAFNALGQAQSFSAALVQELITENEQLREAVAKLEGLVRERDAKLEELQPKAVGQ